MAQPVIPGTSGTPMSWVPSTTPKNLVAGGNNVLAGDWVQVIVSFPAGTVGTPVLTPGHFLFHVLVTPSADDSFAMREDQATIYGGSARNERSEYRIDPGLWVQMPFNAQLAIVAGGNAPSTCVLDVIIKRAHSPRLPPQLAPNPYGISCNPTAGPHTWAPPVVGVPQEVYATWLDVPVTTPIPFPSGAVAMKAVDDSGIPGNPIPLVMTTMAMTLDYNLASGIRNEVAAVAQGGGASNSVPATWQRRVDSPDVNSVVVYQSFGG